MGPAFVALDADGLQGYTGGVITVCEHYNINHAVVMIGFTGDSWIL